MQTANRSQQSEVPQRSLTVPLLMRGSLKDGPFLVCCAGLLFVLVVGSLLLINGAAVAWMVWVAMIAVVFTVSYGLALLWRREWVEMTATGFVLSRRGQQRAFTDEQVESIAHDVRVGFAGAEKCRVIVEVGAGRSQRVECVYTVRVGNTDPLAGFVSRLVGALSARIERGMEGGAELKGVGWSLDARALHVRGEVYPLEAVTFAGFYDRHLCIWRADEERPFLRLPQEEHNVLPLGEILRRSLKGRPGDDSFLPGRPFGRLLLERRSPNLYRYAIVACVCALISLVFLFAAIAAPTDVKKDKDPPEAVGKEDKLLFAVLGCGVLAGLFGFMSWRASKSWLRFHQRGVLQVEADRVVSLFHTEIGNVIWGHRHALVLEPFSGLGHVPIVFQFFTWQHEADLAAVRNLVCQGLARHWAESLASGPVPWTERLRFLPDGLEVETMPSPEPEFVTLPYPQVSYRIERGHCLFFVLGREAWVCKEPVNLPNFYVGLLLLEWLRQEPLASVSGETAPRLTQAADERVTPGPAEGVKERDTDRLPED